MERAVSMKQPSRRGFLAAASAAALVALSLRAGQTWKAGTAPSQPSPTRAPGPLLDPAVVGSNSSVGNFAFVYGNSIERDRFFPFLVHVFRLFPEEALHRLIEAQVDGENPTDEAVYREVATQLDSIKPLLADLSYSLPSLNKQKSEMTEQTVDLLGNGRSFEGYLELGTTGRYLSALEDAIEITGPVFMCHERAPTYSPVHIIDRGRLRKRGDFIPLANYETDFVASIGRAQLDFVTVFIGFHHCPVDLRESFIGSIRDAMRPGATLLLRDHNAKDERMRRVVALAHDVFNMGTRESWDYNTAELRNFYSLDTLHSMLTRFGFGGGERRIFQAGDPTRNALMVYRKR
jgi:hypothetical protein